MPKTDTAPLVIAAIINRPISDVRQRIRAARESGFWPSGRGAIALPVHYARLAVALACDRLADVGPAITAMRNLPCQSPAGPTGTLEIVLTRLIETLPKSPVMGDLDIATGHLSIDVANRELTLHAHDLFGRPIAVRWAAQAEPPRGVVEFVTIPFSSMRDIARSLL